MDRLASGQGWLQVGELMLAFVLSSLVGIEREMRQKTAGLRTYALVGVAAALFTLVSKYGFTDVLVAGRVVLDPSRVAAQLVSGIGFIGGGVIFLRRDVVRGLTTAASVWLTAALGCACGAGLVVLALATVCIHFMVTLGFPALVARLSRAAEAQAAIVLTCRDDPGVLPDVLAACARLGASVLSVRRAGSGGVATPDEGEGASWIRIVIQPGKGRKSRDVLASLAVVPGMVSASVQSGIETE